MCFEETHFPCFLVGEVEIGALGGCAEFTLGFFGFLLGPDFTFHERDSVTVGFESCFEQKRSADGANRVFVANLHFGGDAAGIEFLEDHPSADFIQERGLHSAVEGVNPALVVLRGLPNADDVSEDVVGVFLEEAHVCSERVIGTASEAVVTVEVSPRIDNLS